MKIKVSSEELTKRELSASHLRQAIDAIREEGYIILGNIVSHNHLDLLNEKMTQDSHTIVSSDSDRGKADALSATCSRARHLLPPISFPTLSQIRSLNMSRPLCSEKVLLMVFTMEIQTRLEVLNRTYTWIPATSGQT